MCFSKESTQKSALLQADKGCLCAPLEGAVAGIGVYQCLLAGFSLAFALIPAPGVGFMILGWMNIVFTFAPRVAGLLQYLMRKNEASKYTQFYMWMFSTIYEILAFGAMLVLIFMVYPNPDTTAESMFKTLGLHLILMSLNVYFTTIMGALANDHAKREGGTN